MPSNFFSKLVKNASLQNTPEHPRSPSPAPRRRLASTSVSSVSTTESNGYARRASESKESAPPSGDESSDNPNVTVVPPSPRNGSLFSESATDDDVTPRPQGSPAFPLGKQYGNGTPDSDLRQKPSSLAQVSTLTHAHASPKDEEGLATPTPASRAMFKEVKSERTISPVRSFGNLRRKSRSPNHPRSATIASEQPPPELPQTSPAKSHKSLTSSSKSKSKKAKASDAQAQAQSRHERSASVPSTFSSSSVPLGPNISVTEDGRITSHMITESPTEETPSMGLISSSTFPNFSSTLTVPENSDAASIRSDSSTATTSKKGRWRRRSTTSRNVPAPGPANVSSASLSPTGRKGTGSSLASAIATSSGMAMSSAGISVPAIPVGTSTTPGTTSSLSSRPRRSSDFPRTPPSARSRRTSLSYPTSDLSDRESFHSGVEGNMGMSEEDEDDDLDLNPDDIPVTGFAVASNKRNQDFHELFPTIPEGDYLIEDYGCALQREILIQGRLYISENHMCFHANIFGWITDLCIPMYDVIALDKRMTAFVIPNAILVTTRNAKYTFTSFLSRDTTFDVIFNVWRLARPEDSSMGSLVQSSRGSLDVPANGSVEDGGAGLNGVVAAAATKGKGAVQNKVTQCACSKAGEHFSEVAMESIIPGTPEKIYNLMFTSGFIKDFMRDDQKLTDIQISDWMPTADNPNLLTRVMSYIKPLNGSIGPRSTKCELRDEMIHCDFDNYVAMMTTTRTPDVPSGGVFSVKTRTCITWASSVSTKVLVSTQVEWTGRSFIKGIIEKNAVDGQKTYHADLDRAMREYIHAHQSEFIPQGIDASAVEESTEVLTPEIPSIAERPQPSEEEVRKSREYERNQRGLQWAYDTFEGATKVARQSTEGALELLKDAWDQSSSTTILYFVIVFLVISNLWTLGMIGRREEVGRRREMRRTEVREKWVQGVVQALWEELIANRNTPPAETLLRSNGDWKDEVAEINSVLGAIEQRVESIRESLKDLD